MFLRRKKQRRILQQQKAFKLYYIMKFFLILKIRNKGQMSTLTVIFCKSSFDKILYILMDKPSTEK